MTTRPTDPDRRKLLVGAAGLTTLSALGLPRLAAAQDPLATKDGLVVLNDRPLNAETPPTLLDDELTPTRRHFVRNNGRVPARAERQDPTGWSLTIDGEVERPAELTLEAIQRLPHHTRALVLECGGNGRAGFRPAASGNQWTLGAVGCTEYTGVLLTDLLAHVGVKGSARFVAYYGEDTHLSGDPDKVVISRGCRIEKALDGHCMVAWAMNGEALPALHGWPLRLLVPGHPASASGKWLRRLWIRDRMHDGPKMTGASYRVPRHPVRPGQDVPEADMVIIEDMPVKSIITSPASGHRVASGAPFEVRGHAWSGAGDVAAVDVSHDFGATWVRAALEPPRNRYAWQRWRARISLPQGHHELWARATDASGRAQPMVVPGWNPKGYLNNAMHRIGVEASS